ncbi:antitoxin Xre/MbcA/ParS toxin-binding domain-containing protein [Acinetobacter sp. NigerLNRRAM0016]
MTLSVVLKPILKSTLRLKQGELAILLIDIYRAVYVLSGGDSEWIHYFMNSYNEATKGVPIEQIQTISGLTTVLHFVDSVRAKM